MNSTNIVIASRGIRFANHIIDKIFAIFFCLILGLLSGFLAGGDFDGWFLVFNLLFMFRAYYLFFEGAWKNTPGKWITGTKIVRVDGSKPKFGQILIRWISRIIPFEPFSYLTNSHPIGWHDRLSKTLVVSSSATKEDVQNIDYVALKKNKSNKVLYIVLSIFIGLFIVSFISTVILDSMRKASYKSHNSQTIYSAYEDQY